MFQVVSYADSIFIQMDKKPTLIAFLVMRFFTDCFDIIGYFFPEINVKAAGWFYLFFDCDVQSSYWIFESK
jgi:hypothetical protein